MFMILMVTIVIIFLSDFMDILTKMFQEKQLMIIQAKYYMFLVGVYNNNTKSCYGYGIILITLLIESFLL